MSKIDKIVLEREGSSFYRYTIYYSTGSTFRTNYVFKTIGEAYADASLDLREE